MDNAELAVLSQDLRQMGGNNTLAPHPALGAAFEEIAQWMARQKALGKELCQAASAFAQELIGWANAMKERQSRRNASDPGSAAAVAAAVEAPPTARPPFEAPGTTTGPVPQAPEPEIPEVPDLGPATAATRALRLPQPPQERGH